MGGWDTSEDVSRAVEALVELADEGAVRERDVDRIVTRLQVPAIAYREVLVELEERGIEVVPADAAADEPQTAAGRAPGRRSRGGHGGFGHFLRVAGDHAVLTAEQEQALGRRIHNGDRARTMLEERGGSLTGEQRKVLAARVADGLAARNELVTHNIRLAVHVAKRYFPQIRGLSLEFEDIVQEAVLGLNRAAEKFDPTMGYKFSTYATWWLRQAISRGIVDRGYLIRLPVHVHEHLAKVRRYLRGQEARREPVDVDELTTKLGLPRERVEDLLVLATGGGVGAVRSLDLPVGDDGSDTLGDLIEDGDERSTEDAALDGIEADELRRMLEEKLTSRERQVIELRFGLDGHGERTLEDIGERFGLTRERIRQIQKTAIEKLQQPKILELLAAA
jgi:RNA polymerase sigma factor (sigma-70 family)